MDSVILTCLKFETVENDTYKDAESLEYYSEEECASPKFNNDPSEIDLSSPMHIRPVSIQYWKERNNLLYLFY